MISGPKIEPCGTTEAEGIGGQDKKKQSISELHLQTAERSAALQLRESCLVTNLVFATE